ncbi:hypothetical protein I4O28_06230 [Clostridioides difficile]|nr:hypothetical protein [Clostridioides difficile]MBF9984276.1 hypothetical protein [Clostridioides difficile]MBH7250211.1 hypothetical protein [Clostridioides difficile]MCK1917570.1 hypothetical protein [Clostridioides difficile]MDC2934632.1 hypothetical protein [Clostridioides difficile]
MAKYRKKPVVIDAEPYRKGLEDGIEVRFTDMTGVLLPSVRFELDCWKKLEDFRTRYEKEFIIVNILPYINTLEGKHFITNTDMIITGVKGERYPCKKEIFEMTYELVD